MVLLAPPALWFLGLLLAGNAEVMLNQPSSKLAPLGNVTQLPCTLSGDSITTIASHTIVWLQRKHQGSPKRILYYKDESNQHKVSGVPDRFSAFKDAQSSTCYLAISGVQAEDDGIYYCLTSAGGEYHSALA
ncbi:pre-B lymphocyte protein 3-like [Podarcis lilfordi]|uniref:Pre-B lymphocyte protein 3-like n=1 Tax=Podarcis lilfordi TaxID=74358 RepID=A0AA35PTC4_9SAUR|nr:pre-B lymphocyte protein 3-like [Podarcis lilfordi]